MPVELRPGTVEDLPAVARIQAACPEAAQWPVSDYLTYELTVALSGGIVAGFAVARRLAADESELLNIAVDPSFRQRGIGKSLLAECIAAHPGYLWLEVRKSNSAARKLYEIMGFSETGRRENYYPVSGECAIVMNVHS